MADAGTAATTAIDIADKTVQVAILTQILKKAGISGWGIVVVIVFHFGLNWYWGSRLESQMTANQEANNERFLALEQGDDIDLKDIMVMQFLATLTPPAQAASVDPTITSTP